MGQKWLQHTKRCAQRLPLLLVLCMVMPVFTACDDDDWRITEYLRGTWVSNDDPRSVFTLRFYGNGTGWVEERYDGHVMMYDEFYWDVDRGYIHVQYLSDGMFETWAYDTDRRGLLYGDGINGAYEIRFARWD